MKTKLTTYLAQFSLLIGINILPVMAAPSAEPDTANSNIEMLLAEDNLQQFAFKLDPASMQAQVKSNLSELGYLFSTSGPYKYRLQATLGKISHQATPVGFSFSSGNSDPRSAEFQKADVLPISCHLSLTGNTKPLFSQETNFSAPLTDTTAANNSERLINHLSSVCLEVLNKAKVGKLIQKDQPSTLKPSWLPDIQIEEKIIPKTQNSATDSLTPAVTTEETSKEIIIHNQGTPVIIQFGHERR